ncbi:MAG: FISUMP domain-containing protein [Bacteroidales bacterium]|nr:FISUMP domain-containing protein [Bacteroidales bacterium]MDD3521858.1 FISUMP domain-containing protein [Bacteroidales bacterium]MDD4031220.1 FISUMP domain-containing protein [Bacteroidales bacterium]MDD4435924.1 FISUMP domain-containing protein [Bacteroidales bacterium]
MKKTVLLLITGLLLYSCTPQENPDPEKTKPTVTTGQITGITTTTATCSDNNVSDDGGADVTVSGVCWSTTTNPTTEDSKTEDGVGTRAGTGTGTGTGTFTSNLSGLTPNTTYYVRAYATNSEGTAYGEQKSFKTDQEESGDTFTDSRDGNVYKTVTIGEQTWMAENLAYLPSVVGPGTESNETAYYYVYDYDGTDITAANATEYYHTYGVLYNWPAAMTACPEGWHLPGVEEWDILINYLGGNEIAHGKMQEVGTAHWTTPDAKATNSSGFTGLPGGRYSFGYFSQLGREGNWWSSNEYGTTNAMRFYMHNIIRVDNIRFNRNYGVNVRCLQNNKFLTVFTGQVLTITTTTATCGGNVTGDGGDAVTARGVCWSTSENPTTANSKTTNGSGLGAFTGNITGLTPNTTYYVRAYATNSEGTTYGEQKSFTTLRETTIDYGSFTDSRDGKVYKTITIGEQVWMAENLAFLPNVSPASSVSSTVPYYNVYDYDGTDIAATKATLAYLHSVVGPGTKSYETAYYYVYDYDGTNVAAAKATENYQTYGVLYTWPAAMTACPEGWHLPDAEEWTTLEGNLGGAARAGGKMKEVGTSHWVSPNEGATNESGFTGLPGGHKFGDEFQYIGEQGTWWLSTEADNVWAVARSLSYYSKSLGSGHATKNIGNSVRCVRD